jgi:tRNA (uracil-5-)-methyltransferase
VSNDGIIQYELERFRSEHGITTQIPDELVEYYYRRDHHRDEQMEIVGVLSTGQGIGLCPMEKESGQMIVMVPFTAPGDVVRVKIGKHHGEYAEGEVLQMIQRSDKRNDRLVKCQHFTKCSGCQLQMLSYEDQLEFKTNVVQNAYERFGFDIDSTPIERTVGSPLQYNYRTKLTPHFGSRRDKITLGFETSGVKRLFDLDHCHIATDVINRGLKEDREQLEAIVRQYKRGGTILMRDTSVDGVQSYTTNHKEIVTQEFGGYRFQFPAGEFFQNNNSILPLLLDHIREYIDPVRHKNLVDTYCGSGFFGISLSESTGKLIGIEISKGNLEFARRNARLNRLKNSEFQLGSSEEIFKDLDGLDPRETIVILDPSRKGSTHDYLTQLSHFQPSLIVYISCNVQSQARDLQFFLKETANGHQYQLKSVRGYDFFPQTKHVESLAILQLER